MKTCEKTEPWPTRCESPLGSGCARGAVRRSGCLSSQRPPGRAGVACWAEAGQGPARAAHSPPAPPVAWAPGSFLDLSGAPAPPLQGEGDPTSPAECQEGPVWHTGAWHALSAELSGSCDGGALKLSPGVGGPSTAFQRPFRKQDTSRTHGLSFACGRFSTGWDERVSSLEKATRKHGALTTSLY